MAPDSMRHGVICRLPHEPYGYFGWPSVARQADGTLVVASSGLRAAHVCPWGKTVLHVSRDNGLTWSDARVIQDSPIDDRDAGVISLGGQRLLVSWFTSDTRIFKPEQLQNALGPERFARYRTETAAWTDEVVFAHLGSWTRTSPDGQSWSDPVPAPVMAPHGPIRLADGRLFYLGKAVSHGETFHKKQHNGPIRAAISRDEGLSWQILGDIPLPAGTEEANFHEPHVAAMPSGRLVGQIRYQHSANCRNHDPFTIFQTESADGGITWTEARPTGAPGSPPHLLRHSSGALVSVFGHRQPPFGQQAMVSRDEGRSWSAPIVLRSDGPDSDLGYPASVELDDTSIFTVYYQKAAAGENASLLWTRWNLHGDAHG